MACTFMSSLNPPDPEPCTLIRKVTVVGYPIGGDNACVTVGVVSRIATRHSCLGFRVVFFFADGRIVLRKGRGTLRSPEQFRKKHIDQIPGAIFLKASLTWRLSVDSFPFKVGIALGCRPPSPQRYKPCGKGTQLVL